MGPASWRSQEKPCGEKREERSLRPWHFLEPCEQTELQPLKGKVSGLTWPDLRCPLSCQFGLLKKEKITSQPCAQPPGSPSWPQSQHVPPGTGLPRTNIHFLQEKFQEKGSGSHFHLHAPCLDQSQTQVGDGWMYRWMDRRLEET